MVRHTLIPAAVCGTLLLSGCAADFVPAYDLSDKTSPFARENQDASSHYEQGLAYHQGLGVPRNYDRAKRHYLEAINVDADTRAMNELAVLLLTTEPSDQDVLDAYRYFLKAAEKGNSSARFNLGLSYYDGLSGITQNMERGLDFIATSANQGNMRAQAFMIEWIDKEAQARDTGGDVLRNYALKMIDNGDVDRWDIATADSKYRDLWMRFFSLDLADRSKMLSDILAVESACVECRSRTSVDTVARKLEEIETWRTQAENGDRGAEYNLGLSYLTGDGVPKNVEKGARLTIRSADAGYIPAQYSLGKLFLDGKGIEKNKPMAYAWFSIAASDDWGFRESRWALKMVETMEDELSPTEIDFAQNWAGSWSKNSQWYLEE